MNRLTTRTLCLTALLSLNVGAQATGTQSAVEKLINTHESMAKVTKVTVSANLSDSDSGSIKEFGISIGHHYFHNKKISKVHRGKAFEAELVTFLDKESIEISAKELDEYHGMSIDALIALPFSFFNPDDIFVEPTMVELLDKKNSISGRSGNDSLGFQIGVAQEITGQELFLRMNRDIKGCMLDKGSFNISATKEENRVKCRNFKGSIYALFLSGYNEGEIEEIILELEPRAREDQLGYMIGDLNWYKRNFDK